MSEKCKIINFNEAKERIEKKREDNETLQRAYLFWENYENGFFPRMTEDEFLNSNDQFLNSNDQFLNKNNMFKFDTEDRKKSLESFRLFLEDDLNSGRD